MAAKIHPVAIIRKDHRTVKGLFNRFERASGAERQRVAEEIIEELSRHATMEELLVYPLLRLRDKRLNDDVLEALEEHHVAKATLAELDKMKVSDERYEAKMTILREMIEHHIEEEEETLLPRLEKLLDDEEAEALAAEMLASKMAAPDHPHPMAPDTPPGNVIAGALAKILDTGKDLLRKVTSPAKAEGHRRQMRRGRAEVKKAATKLAGRTAGRSTGRGAGKKRAA